MRVVKLIEVEETTVLVAVTPQSRDVLACSLHVAGERRGRSLRREREREVAARQRLRCLASHLALACPRRTDHKHVLTRTKHHDQVREGLVRDARERGCDVSVDYGD